MTTAASEIREQAIGALINLGYPKRDSIKSVDIAIAKVGDTDLEQVIRTVLKGDTDEQVTVKHTNNQTMFVIEHQKDNRLYSYLTVILFISAIIFLLFMSMLMSFMLAPMLFKPFFVSGPGKVLFVIGSFMWSNGWLSLPLALSVILSLSIKSMRISLIKYARRKIVTIAVFMLAACVSMIIATVILEMIQR